MSENTDPGPNGQITNDEAAAITDVLDDRPFEVVEFAKEFPKFLRDLASAADTKPLKLSTIRRADSINRRSAEYLWYPYIPAHDLTAIAGEGDGGKTWLFSKAAAEVTKGGTLPADPNSNRRKRATSIQHPADVILIQRENDEGSVIIPRFEELDGDRHRLILPDEPFLFTGASEVNANDLESYLRLGWYLKATGAKLIGFDPLTGFLDAQMKDAREMRGVLERLQVVARFGKAAVLFVAHMNKDYESPIKHRMSGSAELYNVPRSVVVVSQDPNGTHEEDHSDHVLYHEKNNLGQKGGALGFSVTGNPDDKNLAFDWQAVDQDRTVRAVQEGNNGYGDDTTGTKPQQIQMLILKNLYAADKPVFTTVLKDAIAKEMGFRDGKIPSSTWERAVDGLPFKGFEVDHDGVTPKPGSGIWAWSPLRSIIGPTPQSELAAREEIKL